MFNIESYLKRVGGLIDKGVLYQKEIAEVIHKHTNISKGGNFFEVKDGILKAQLTSGEKNMMFLKKEALLTDLAQFNVKGIR
jgi:hypothetical protein